MYLCSIKFICFLVLLSSCKSVIIPLNSNWIITNGNSTISIKNQSLPSGVYTALEDTGITESALYSYNDINLRWIAFDNWTYTLDFDAPNDYAEHLHVHLTFHGIDTIANISLNGVHLGTTDNMFVRYVYDVRDILKNTNKLIVKIDSAVTIAAKLAKQYPDTPPNCQIPQPKGECHVNFLRKMQASFSWDWGLAVPSMGIWKPVELELYDSALVRDVNYNLTEQSDNWNLTVVAFLELGSSHIVSNVVGNISFDLFNISNITKSVHLPNLTENMTEFTITHTMIVAKNNVKRWWPNGFGEQNLYKLKVTWRGFDEKFEQNDINSVHRRFFESSKIVSVGFRTIELVQDQRDGGFSFYFRVNKLPIFMKGSNWIPMSIFPERHFNQEKLEHLLSSARDANMNMIRVWGGGVYESDQFYDLADQYGILLWQDLMFACSMYPVFNEFLESVKIELKQNVRRLQSHPSIAIWAANNENEVALRQNWYGTNQQFDRFENEYIKLYVNITRPAVESNDPMRVWLPSSPSNGLKTRDGNWINELPQDWKYGDIHYYNYSNNGWRATEYPRPRFVSEYGYQSFPSMRSWRLSMRKNDNLTDLMEHRQHGLLGHAPIILQIYYNLPDLNQTSKENYNSAIIYFSQLSQAMIVKTASQAFRKNQIEEANTMGALYWQLNDVWVTPSWSGIDYNGDYKMLHYWMKNTFANLSTIVQNDARDISYLYVVSDIVDRAVMVNVLVELYSWDNLEPELFMKKQIEMDPLTVLEVGNWRSTDILMKPRTIYNSFFIIKLFSDGNLIDENFLLPTKLNKIENVRDPKLELSLGEIKCEDRNGIAELLIKVSYPAIFVYIELLLPNIKYHKFSRNGFIQIRAVEKIEFNFVVDEQSICNNLKLGPTDFKVMTVNDFILGKI